MPSKRLRDYIEADKRAKEAESQKAANRSYVEKLLRKAKGLGVYLRGVSYQEREKVKFDDNELYDWVRSQLYDEFGSFNVDKWEKLTTTKIDEGKLEQAVAEGWMDLSNLPETCYTVSISKVVAINHTKLNNE